MTDHIQVALKRISRRFTNTQGFKAETQALLRIFDNGGHPNISGLRGKTISCLWDAEQESF